MRNEVNLESKTWINQTKEKKTHREIRARAKKQKKKRKNDNGVPITLAMAPRHSPNPNPEPIRLPQSTIVYCLCSLCLVRSVLRP